MQTLTQERDQLRAQQTELAAAAAAAGGRGLALAPLAAVSSLSPGLSHGRPSEGGVSDGGGSTGGRSSHGGLPVLPAGATFSFDPALIERDEEDRSGQTLTLANAATGTAFTWRKRPSNRHLIFADGAGPLRFELQAPTTSRDLARSRPYLAPSRPNLAPISPYLTRSRPTAFPLSPHLASSPAPNLPTRRRTTAA